MVPFYARGGHPCTGRADESAAVSSATQVDVAYLKPHKRSLRASVGGLLGSGATLGTP